MKKIIKAPNEPEITLFVPFTRLWFVDDFLFNLGHMMLPWENVEVVFYNDTKDAKLQKKLKDWLTHIAPQVNGAILYKSDKPALGDYALVGDRRKRIIAVKEDSKKLISDSSEYVFCLEDDTIAPVDAFNRLITYLVEFPDIAVASGIQVGRWKYRIVGAWNIHPLKKPTTVSTVRYRGAGAQFVDGVGWYCYVTRTSDYKAATYRSEAECLGPDVCYAWDLRKQGKRVLIDWNVPTAHVAIDNSFYPNDRTEIATWRKDNGSWKLV